MNTLSKDDYNFILNMLGLIGSNLNEQLNKIKDDNKVNILQKEILELANVKIKIEEITSNHYN